jgi:hypothetical protein
MGSRPDKNWQKFHHREDKVAVKAVPAYSEKHLNQNWQENKASLSQKAGTVELAGFYAAIVSRDGDYAASLLYPKHLASLTLNSALQILVRIINNEIMEQSIVGYGYWLAVG